MAQYYSLLEIAFGGILGVEQLVDEEYVLLLEVLALQGLHIAHSGRRCQPLAYLAQAGSYNLQWQYEQ